MIGAEEKVLQRIAAQMQRVLIVDPQPAAARFLSELLRNISPCQIWTAAEADRGLATAERVGPHMVFVERCAELDGVAFTRALRRSDYLCRKAPVIMVSAESTASLIVAARDCGVHEFLRKPYTLKELLRRLDAVAARPRDWVEGISYVGPDRRRFNSGDYSGPLKRRVDHALTPTSARIVQALKILKAAVAGLEADPRQAHRAMLAQAGELEAAAETVCDARLGAAAAALALRLAACSPTQLTRADLAPMMSEFWDYLPDETARSAA